jgi:tRNA (guanine37-N1)-methyltransferase
MKITFLTLFPEIFTPVLAVSILGRAQKKGLVEYEIVNIRDFGIGSHQIVDDTPYGGGVGMVLKPEVLTAALQSVKTKASHVILTSASGIPYTQVKAKKYVQLEHLIVVCGHYEGVDQRFIDLYVDEEISIGDYVLTGGELPAMVIADSITRLIKGVLEKSEATEKESYENGLLEHPHYTRPAVFENKTVPEVLTSGDHKKIDAWRLNESVAKTKKNRPDLLS